jgi:hypothetical protein
MSYQSLSELNAAAAANPVPVPAAGRLIVNPLYPASHRAIVQRAINYMLSTYWCLPATGDIIPNLEAFKAYIRAFLFYAGFDVVKEGGGLVVTPSVRL